MTVVLSATIMLVDLFVAITQVTDSVAIMQLKASAVGSLCIIHMHTTISIVIMQVTVSVVTVSSSNFLFLSLTDTQFFIKLTRNIRRRKALHQICISPL